MSEGENGYLCKKMDADDLERCMVKFVEVSQEQRKAMGESGRRKMEREFDKVAVVGETVRAILE